MSLVHASIIPHSPVLLPTIGSEHVAKLQHTIDAIKEVEGEMYVTQPETIFVISPHGPTTNEAFSIHLAPQFTINFSEFGDTTTTATFQADIELISKIREYADSNQADAEFSVPVNIVDHSDLDYGSAVPLYYLTQHLPQVKIVPISVSMLDAKQHFQFGRLLRRVAIESNKRVAIIASAELSHFPAQPHDNSAGQTYDAKIQEMIKTGKYDDILKLNLSIVEAAQAEHGHQALLILFGALSDLECKPQVISYEVPLGVGMLVTQFNLL